MNSKLFRKMDGVYAQNLLKGETVDRQELGIDSGVAEDSDAIEHVYIVFTEGTDIESGIAAIEQKVLGGSPLEINRKDSTGNAIVAVVNSSTRKEIESLPEVSKVKINEAADVKKNQESESVTEDSTAEVLAASEAVTETPVESKEEISEVESTYEESVADILNTESQSVLSEEAAETHSTVIEIKNEGAEKAKGSDSIVIPLVIGGIVLAAVIATVVRVFLKKR